MSFSTPPPPPMNRRFFALPKHLVFLLHRSVEGRNEAKKIFASFEVLGENLQCIVRKFSLILKFVSENTCKISDPLTGIASSNQKSYYCKGPLLITSTPTPVYNTNSLGAIRLHTMSTTNIAK